jgi:hypothetical protein
VRRPIEASARVCLLARSSRAGATAHPPLPCLLPCNEPHLHLRRQVFALSPNPYDNYDYDIHISTAGRTLRAYARALTRPTAITATRS